MLCLICTGLKFLRMGRENESNTLLLCFLLINRLTSIFSIATAIRLAYKYGPLMSLQTFPLTV
jgi:hypothetical protein